MPGKRAPMCRGRGCASKLRAKKAKATAKKAPAAATGGTNILAYGRMFVDGRPENASSYFYLEGRSPATATSVARALVRAMQTTYGGHGQAGAEDQRLGDGKYYLNMAQVTRPVPATFSKSITFRGHTYKFDFEVRPDP